MPANNSQQLKRKNIRLPAGRYRGRQSYFVTVCFHDRRPYGKNVSIAKWLIAKLKKNSESCEFFVHAYCVMPDHIHILASAKTESSNLVKFIEAFKQETAIEFEQRQRLRLWQFKYYDRILRSDDALDRVAWYIWLNPVRKNLSAAPADYPFAGSLTDIGKKLLQFAAPPEWTPPWKDAALKAAALRSNLPEAI
jgi:REP element-mobilizing transposase RayT